MDIKALTIEQLKEITQAKLESAKGRYSYFGDLDDMQEGLKAEVAYYTGILVLLNTDTISISKEVAEA